MFNTRKQAKQSRKQSRAKQPMVTKRRRYSRNKQGKVANAAQITYASAYNAHQSEVELSKPAFPYNFEHERASHTKQIILANPRKPYTQIAK